MLHVQLVAVVPVFPAAAFDLRVMIAIAAEQPAKLGEALVDGSQRRLVSQMPLTEHAGGIARIP